VTAASIPERADQTHSPVLLACPDAAIFQLSDSGIEKREYDDVDAVELWRDFLEAPDRFLRHLLSDDDDPIGPEGP
jgi:hypothetical protein